MYSYLEPTPDTRSVRLLLPCEVILNEVLQYVEESERKFFCVNRFFQQHITMLRTETQDASRKLLTAELSSVGLFPTDVKTCNADDLVGLYIRLIVFRLRETTVMINQLKNNTRIEQEVQGLIGKIKSLENTVNSAPRAALHAIENVLPTLSSAKIFPSGIIHHCFQSLHERLREFGKEWVLESSR